MNNLGVLLTYLAYVAILVTRTTGRPVSEEEMRRVEIKAARRNIILLKEVRPCFARLLEVRADILEHGDIKTDPHYVPECTIDGIKWRAAQCDHHDNGSCFCVHEENGEILEHTRNSDLHREGLSCGRAVKGHAGHECFHMQDEFEHKQETFGLEGHAPLFYYPECTTKGKFKALQRNDRSFFCVDTENGDVIPETETIAGTMPPLTEDICQAYDDVWNKFKQWKESRNIEEDQPQENIPVDQSSCKPGFIFTECGCPIKCTHETTAEVNRTCICRQACVCPDNKFDLDGRCVNLEECNEAKPPSNVLHAEKLQDLTNNNWSEYKLQFPNVVLETYNSQGMEELVYAGGPVAYDENPGSNFFKVEPPPEEPMEAGFRNGEPIPGDDEPYLLDIIRGTASTDEEEGEERESYPEEGEEDIREYYRQQEREYYPEEENTRESYQENERGYYPEEETGRESYRQEEREYPEEENTRESYPQEREFYPEEENTREAYPQEKEFYPEEENTRESYPQERGFYPEEENTQESYPQEERERYPEEENTREYFPQEEREFDPEEENTRGFYPQEEKEYFPQEENSDREVTPEEENEIENRVYVSDRMPESYDVLDNRQSEEPQGDVDQRESSEPEDEHDERISNERLIEHQVEEGIEFSSVPRLRDEEIDEHLTPPCDEPEEADSQASQPSNRLETAEEAAIAEINRVLGENGILIEATLEKPTPLIKKNSL